MKKAFSSLLVIMLIACSADYKNKVHIALPGVNPPYYSIAIQPFKGTDSHLVNKLQKELQSTLQAKVKVLPFVNLPGYAYYAPQKRYWADSVLVYLKHNKPNQFDYIVGITEKDISTTLNGKKNWGIMGLGYMPGVSCVVSTFRVERTEKQKKLFEQNMKILCLHELGHNFSLQHCANTTCIMQDAKGKNKLSISRMFCKKCSLFLASNRFVK